jgi:hypothetical protein
MYKITKNLRKRQLLGFWDRVVHYFAEICRFGIGRLVTKIWGLTHLKNLRICDNHQTITFFVRWLRLSSWLELWHRLKLCKELKVSGVNAITWWSGKFAMFINLNFWGLDVVDSSALKWPLPALKCASLHWKNIFTWRYVRNLEF